MMLLYEQGLNYWTVARRYHINRANPAIEPTAVRDMQRELAVNRSEAVKRRIHSFIANHTKQPGPIAG